MNMTELAKKAGFTVTGSRIESPYIGGSDISHRLAEFAALVRAEREWVDLTDDEIDTIEQRIYSRTTQKGRPQGIYVIELIRAVIAAFKEKNK